KPRGVMADFVEVTDPAWEKACEIFLHEELEYVVVADWEEAARGVELMQADADGRATFLVHGICSQAEGTAQAEACTTDLPRLKDILRLTNGFTEAPDGFLPRLARCLLAGDRSDAQRLAGLFPDCYFLLPDGTTYHAHAVSGGRKTAGGPLALKRE